jgi:lipoprotein-releasing system ATP-binding protein
MADLTVQNVTRQFCAGGPPLEVLRDVSFELSAGENMAILGPSGSGKSTLLHILGTLLPPTTGVVRLGGEDVTQLNGSALAHFRNQQIGFVFQDHHLLPQCTVLENVLVPVLAEGKVSSEAAMRGEALLERVGLSARLGHRPGELSGGERQRVAVARALICQPALLLADEPTGNLDRTNAASIGRLLLEVAAERQMMLIAVTHSQELAGALSRRMELDDGRLHDVP